MTESQRDILFRYLHERGTMSSSERLSVEWQLLSDRESRRAYAEIERLHRVLSRHYAPGKQFVAPLARLSWLRVGLVGFAGAAAVAGSLLRMQDVRHDGPDVPASVVTQTRCGRCHKKTANCPHCQATTAPTPLKHCSE